jgi:ribonuclease E
MKTKKMLVDSRYDDETRVIVLSENGVLEEFDFEVNSRKTIRSNIYLARVARVEPSLQAAFMDFGGNKHGFLAFSDIHPDYYRIPIDERENVLDKEERFRLLKQYKIQEVIHRDQVMLVQAVKEERGTKGAALTTYLSLSGRYCILMPNTGKGGGVSRKISDEADRKRLKKIVEKLDIPDGMGIIVRTSGTEKKKTDLKKDLEYLLKIWTDIKEKTLKSIAPQLIYTEDILIKRAIRDIYKNSIEEIIVEGENCFKAMKGFMRVMVPGHAKRVKLYQEKTPLFQYYSAEKQIEDMHNSCVQLESGGYLIINHTEALIAIDVNSGKSNKEKNIEDTALKTNIEAAIEISRQARLRDLSGLIVIDFIDMEDKSSVELLERTIKELFSTDRAKVIIGKISQFCIAEISRQRLNSSLYDVSTTKCKNCAGRGYLRSFESVGMSIIRNLEDYCMSGSSVILKVGPGGLDSYLLNTKRGELFMMEKNNNAKITVVVDHLFVGNEYFISFEQIEEVAPKIHYRKQEDTESLIVIKDKKLPSQKFRRGCVQQKDNISNIQEEKDSKNMGWWHRIDQ